VRSEYLCQYKLPVIPSVIEPTEFWYMKVKFLFLHIGHLYPPSHTTGINFCQRSSRLQTHSAVRILK
jgi:hypothetical protein